LQLNKETVLPDPKELLENFLERKKSRTRKVTVKKQELPPIPSTKISAWYHEQENIFYPENTNGTDLDYEDEGGYDKPLYTLLNQEIIHELVREKIYEIIMLLTNFYDQSIIESAEKISDKFLVKLIRFLLSEGIKQ